MDPETLLAELRATLAATTFPPFMNTRETARFLSVSEEHLFDMRKARVGPPFLQLSTKVVRYDREAVATWARAHAVPVE